MAKKSGGKGKKAAPSTAPAKSSTAKPKKPAAKKPSAPAKKPAPKKTPASTKAAKATPAVTTKTKGKDAKPRSASKSAKAPADTKAKGAKKSAKAEAPSAEAKRDKKGAAKAVEAKTVEAKAKPEKAPKVSKSKAPASKSKPEKTAKADDKPTKKGSATEAKAPVAPGERYSVQSKESMDASRAAAARFAKAAGLQPVQSNVNGDLDETPAARLTKSPFSKKQLSHFREVLLLKRGQLVGDVTSMESEALTGGSGSLSHLPQHMADQGSDTYDQSLALDLAASQRGLLKEIDEALARIEAGTYGICDMLGTAIAPERLEETPWARYSIEAARRLERGAYAR